MLTTPSTATLNRTLYTRLVIACGIGAVALGLTIWLAGSTLTGEFDGIESDRAQRRAEIIYTGFEAEVALLHGNLRDFSQWDAAYEFVISGDSQFIENHFGFQSLRNLHVDMVWVGDREGREIYSALLDESVNRVRVPAPAAFTRTFTNLPQQALLLRTLGPGRYLLNTPLGITSFGINQISRSDGSSPQPYWMVFARVLRPDDIQKIASRTNFKLEMLPLPLAADNHLLRIPEINAFLEGNESATGVLLDGTLIESVARLSSVDGQPLALLHSESPGNISALGRTITLKLLGAIVALVVLFGGVLVALIWRLHKSFAERAAHEHRHQKITAQLQELLILADTRSLRVVEMNQAARTELGYQPEEYAELTLRDLLPDLDIAEMVRTGRQGTATRRSETPITRKLGTALDVDVSLTVVDDHDPPLVCIAARDISDKRRAEKLRREHQRRLIHIALHDSLTRLPNRMYLHARLPHVIRKLDLQPGAQLALIYLDVDHFKRINDSYGHGCGDQLLRIVASRLRACVQRKDMVVRMGGDEFVIVAVLPEESDAADHLAMRLQHAIQAPIMVEGRDLSTSSSMGIAIYPRDGDDVESLLKNADVALYKAKEAGRRCHRFFSPDMNADTGTHLVLEQALRHAVGTDQISVVYQPVIALQSGRLVSMEALARWRHPEQGMVSPAVFIPVAEASGLIVELGEQVLTMVVQQLRHWLDAGVPITPVAVNVSALQLERTDFAHVAQRIAAANGLEMKWLRFEITESALLKDTEKLIGTLTTLRRMGSTVLIDDFGTGYSSLNYLHRLPIDTVKIDRSFVTELAITNGRSPVIEAVVEMAHKLHLTTVAEGIETAQQHQWLLNLGCEMGQGFHYSRPVNAHQCAFLFRSLGDQEKLSQSMVVRALKYAG